MDSKVYFIFLQKWINVENFPKLITLTGHFKLGYITKRALFKCSTNLFGIPFFMFYYQHRRKQSRIICNAIPQLYITEAVAAIWNPLAFLADEKPFPQTPSKSSLRKKRNRFVHEAELISTITRTRQNSIHHSAYYRPQNFFPNSYPPN